MARPSPTVAQAPPAQQFRIAQVGNRMVVNVIDGTTGEVVQQVNSDAWLRVATMLANGSQSTFDASA